MSSELPPDIALQPEPTDPDPLDAIRPDRPRIWPETPRPLKTQIKRPLEDWLSDFTERVRQQDAKPGGKIPVERRRRPRGLARLIPVPLRTEPSRPEGEPPPPARRGRGRRRGRDRSGQPTKPAQPQLQAPGQRGGRGPSRGEQAGRGRPRGQRPQQAGQQPPPGASPGQGPSPGTNQGTDRDHDYRRGRRRSRGRRRGPGGQAPPGPSGQAPPGPSGQAPPGPSPPS